jgi:decaprenyl-phosphate phosphoribosyltransferase
VGPTARRRNGAAALLALSRPQQWSKNVLVAAAPFAAGVLDHPSVLWRTIAVGASFLGASVATYAVNDLADVSADRAHPVKRLRPLASRDITAATAKGCALVAAFTSLALAATLGPYPLLVVGTYLALTLGYSQWMKRVPVLETVVVAAGFVLRAWGGAVANDLPVSSWFLLVCLFGSLFLVVAKRGAESGRAKSVGVHPTRDVLEAYPATWLQQMMTVSLTGTVLAYALWAVQDVGTDVFAPVLAATVVPFLMVLMRYALLVARGGGETPESDAVHDRALVLTAVVWAAMCIVGLYVA